MSRVIWLTGLPGSGKTTLATRLAAVLKSHGRPVCVLDGDVLRKGLCSNLGFSAADRHENIRRAAEVAALFADHHPEMVVIAAFISPHEAGRAAARTAIGAHRYREVYLDTPVWVCAQRDPKGHYRRANDGTLPNFTGVGSPYEPPLNPDLVLQTDKIAINECVRRLVDLVLWEDA